MNSKMNPENAHKMGLILGVNVNTLYMLFCFFKLFPVVGEGLITVEEHRQFVPQRNSVRKKRKGTDKTGHNLMSHEQSCTGWQSLAHSFGHSMKRY